MSWIALSKDKIEQLENTMKIESELKKVWDAAPKDVQEADNYAFIISWDWKDTPTEFKGLPVYRFRPIPEQTIYLMPNPMWKNIEADKV